MNYETEVNNTDVEQTVEPVDDQMIPQLDMQEDTKDDDMDFDAKSGMWITITFTTCHVQCQTCDVAKVKK